MAYKTLAGTRRVWTYLPEDLVWQLRAVAVQHRRSVAAEIQVVLEAYLAQEVESNEAAVAVGAP